MRAYFQHVVWIDRNWGNFPGAIVGEVADLAASTWKTRAERGAYAPTEVDDLGYKITPPANLPRLRSTALTPARSFDKLRMRAGEGNIGLEMNGSRP